MALILVGVGVLGVAREDRTAEGSEPGCGTDSTGCDVRARPPLEGPLAGAILPADAVCGDAGYLCAELENGGRVRVQRWRNHDGPLVVHVPRPEVVDAGAARELQTAAAMGIRAWNNQPFAILVDTRGDRDPHFAVRWAHLGSGHLGAARTRWSSESGLSVLAIELALRGPYDGGGLRPAHQIRLTAAHEMGHALGLGHSDSTRDVMYPTNTATAVSARDRRSMEVLYELEDGAEIVR